VHHVLKHNVVTTAGSLSLSWSSLLSQMQCHLGYLDVSPHRRTQQHVHRASPFPSAAKRQCPVPSQAACKAQADKALCPRFRCGPFLDITTSTVRLSRSSRRRHREQTRVSRSQTLLCDKALRTSCKLPTLSTSLVYASLTRHDTTRADARRDSSDILPWSMQERLHRLAARYGALDARA
jgi:hypothetical protein